MFNLKSRKKLEEREFKVHRREMDADLVESYRGSERNLLDSLNGLRRMSFEQTQELEHQYHSGKEQKMTELARLDEQIKAKAEVIKRCVGFEQVKAELEIYRSAALSKDLVIDSLRQELKRADENLKVVIGKLSKVDVDKIAVSVGPVNSK